MSKLNQNYQPPKSLQRYCEVLLSLGVKGKKLEAERLTGITRQQFYYHFKEHPEFRDWFSNQCKAALQSYESTVIKKLLEKIIYDRDVSAMRLYYELKGDIQGKLTGINQSVNVSIENASVKNTRLSEENRRLIERFEKLFDNGQRDSDSLQT